MTTTERVGEFEIVRGGYHGVRGGRVWVLVHDTHGDCGTYRSKRSARANAVQSTVDLILRARAPWRKEAV